MKRLMKVAALCVVVAAQLAWATVPRTISYQGILTDNNDVVVPDASYNITFRLYNVAAGGTALWQELQSVPVADGRFNVILGSSVSLDGLAFDATYYLALEVQGDAEMTPRIELASAPYALNARAFEPGAAVKSINGLTDEVTLAAGANVSITQSNDTLFIAASGSGGLALPYSGSSSANIDAFEILQTGLGAQGRAGNFEIQDIGNNNNALRAATDGQGDAFLVQHTGSNGIGSAAIIEKTGVTAVDPTLVIKAPPFGRAAEVQGQLIVRNEPISGGNSSAVVVYRGTGFERTVALQTGPRGGHITLADTLGNQFAGLRQGEFGFGGTLELTRSLTGNGITLWGNIDGLGNPSLHMTGNVNALSFEMKNTGDQTVYLPGDAISAPEVLDEPGTASNASNTTVTFSPGINVILSRTITVPAAGYVYVIGSCQLTANQHNTGTDTNIDLGVSDNATSLPANQDLSFFVPAIAPTGLYAVPATAHGLFEVTAGSHTFYLLGDENTGNGQAADNQLTLIYLPTMYGTVTSTSVAGPNGTDAQSPTRGGLSSGDIASERRSSEADNVARLQRELDRMREELARIENRLAGQK